MEIRDVVYVERLRTPELIRWHSREHTHNSDEWEIHAFLGGEGRFVNGGARHVIERSTLYLTAPLVRHAVQPADGGGTLTYYAVLFAPGGARDDQALLAALATDAVQRTLPERFGVRHRLLLEELASRFAHRDPSRLRAAEHQLAAALWELSWNAEDGEPVVGDSAHAVHVQRAISLLDRARERDVSIGEVAEQLGVSQEHLTRSFTREVGVSPLTYHRRARIERAGSLIINSRRSVKEIAWELGFPSASQFARTFRSVTGMSPTRFRSRYYATAPTAYATRIIA